MIRFSKNLFLNPASIQISGIPCSSNNIVKILNAFNCKWILATVDSAAEESALLTSIRDEGLTCFVKPRSAKFAEISAVIPHAAFEDFLNKAIKEAPENIFVFNLRDPASSAMCLQHSSEELVITGMIDVFISISLDENALGIWMNKSLTSPQDVYKKIKTLHFDSCDKCHRR